MLSGVYVIENTVTGKVYVGSAANLEYRWRGHLARLRKRNHHSIKLQRSWDKHGESAFKFRPVLICAKDSLLMYEQIVMDFHHAAKRGYNMTPTAGSLLGHRTGPESSQRRSAARRGKGLGRKPTPTEIAKRIATMRANRANGKLRPPPSEETRAKIGAASRGRARSATTRQKQAAALRGQKRPPEAIENMRQAQSKRKPLTPEQRARMSAAAKRRHEREMQMGTRRQFSAQFRAHMGQGRPVPDSEETRRKRSEAGKRRTDLVRNERGQYVRAA